MAETVTQTRAKLAEALSHDLRQLGLDPSGAFVESQQREIERLESLLSRIRNQSLDWALACPHDCPACDAMYEVIREAWDFPEPPPQG